MVSRHSSVSPSGQASPAERPHPVRLVGHRLRRLRKSQRVSVADLAAAAGLQAADLVRLEKGEYRVSLDVLFRVLGALRVEGTAFLAELARTASDPLPEDGVIREL